MSGLSFHWYGFLIALGVLAACTVSEWLSRRRGYMPNLVWDGVWWVLAPAVLGARLYHVLDRWGDIYAAHPISSVMIWGGGLGIIGGLAGGTLGLVLFWLKRRQESSFPPFRNLLDMVFFGLPLGQAVGRLGNWVNQEVYGFPTSLPWGIAIDQNHRLPGFESFEKFHPLFAYEAGLCLIGFLIMLFVELIYSKNIKESEISKIIKYVHNSYSGFYLFWYGVVRFFLEFIRLPAFYWSIRVGRYSFDMAQIFSLFAIILGVLLMRRPASQPASRPAWPRPQTASGQRVRST